jgi:hypothetical protein
VAIQKLIDRLSGIVDAADATLPRYFTTLERIIVDD